MSSVREEFCETFESKLLDPAYCCLSKRGRSVVTGVPSCLGHHLRSMTDPSVAALYGVYWGAKSRLLSEEQVSRALHKLYSVASTKDIGMMFPANANPKDCIPEKLGLEVFAGCFSGDPVVVSCGSPIAASVAIERDEGDWKTCREIQAEEVTFEHPSATGLPLKSYSYLKAAVGRFVGADGVEISVFFRLCKSGTDRWMEYRDRRGWWLRYPFMGFSDTCKGGSFAPLAALFLDARGESYVWTDDNAFSHSLRGTDGIPRFIARAMKWADSRARGAPPRELVMVCMPQPPDTPSSSASAALVEACWREATGESGVSSASVAVETLAERLNAPPRQM
nr:hypothetical protein TetV2_00320 [Oceanusvirus sp.]